MEVNPCSENMGSHKSYFLGLKSKSFLTVGSRHGDRIAVESS